MESADNIEDTITEEIREEETDTNQNFWIKYLEVGQADAALVYSDGTNVWVETEREAADKEIMVPGSWRNGAISDEESAVYTDIEADYICNENSRKFHYPTCDSVVKMSEKNKRYYNGSREDLLNGGYEPCGGCKP